MPEENILLIDLSTDRVAPEKQKPYCLPYCYHIRHYLKAVIMAGLSKETIAQYKEQSKILLLQGLNAHQVALKIGCSPTSVAKWHPELASCNLGKRIIDWEKYKQDIVDLRNQGKGYSEISRIIGIDKKSIAKFCKKNNIEMTAEEKDLSKKYALSEDKLLQRIDTLAFEYLGGYKNYDSTIRIRCKVCNAEFNRNADAAIRHGITCPNCLAIERERIKSEKNIAKNIAKEKLILKKQAEKQQRQNEKDEQDKQRKYRTCKNCGVIFYSDTGRTLCDKCKKDTIRIRNRKYYKSKEIKRRIKIQSAMVDNDITVQALAERDNNICYLCNKPVDFSDYYDNGVTIICGNNYPSIDHVIPLAKGGLHSWDNVKLAHRICNSKKSDNLVK